MVTEVGGLVEGNVQEIPYEDYSRMSDEELINWFKMVINTLKRLL